MRKYVDGSIAPFNHSFGTECPAAGRKIIECTLAERGWQEGDAMFQQLLPVDDH